ncbi:MAG: tyrosine--tRNA ligase [Planctomycetaceae bacterium]|nr:tyrosine--tRNA ligase [Planctomycetaceae bacterium]
MSFPPVEDQLALIRRGVEKIVPEEDLRRKLEESAKTGRPLRIKYGIDPTAADVHLGHSVPLRKMRQFQELGHQAVIIIGNYTAMVGDPSGRDEARKKQLTADEVEANARYYLSQVGKVIDLEHAEVHRNGDWFARMNFTDLLRLCGRVTVAQLLTRDDFSKRMKAESPIYLHECLYPIMQAFDSVVIDADVELGGTEQLYSFMLARDLQKDAGVCEQAAAFRPSSVPTVDVKDGSQRQQLGVMSPILVGTDGTRRMGKSLGNYIGISEDPYEMTKKFMQIPDDLMRSYFELLTNMPLDEIDTLLSGHPKEAKVRLGQLVIGEYHDAAAAEDASSRWQREIGEGALPTDLREATLSASLLDGEGRMQAAALLKELELVASTSEGMRRIQGGAVQYIVDGVMTKVADKKCTVPVTDGMIVRAGKKDMCVVRLS